MSIINEYPGMKKDKQFINHFYYQIENIYNNRYGIGNLQQQNKILLSDCMKFYSKINQCIKRKKLNKHRLMIIKIVIINY